jgi:hypothetical protein
VYSYWSAPVVSEVSLKRADESNEVLERHFVVVMLLESLLIEDQSLNLLMCIG